MSQIKEETTQTKSENEQTKKPVEKSNESTTQVSSESQQSQNDSSTTSMQRRSNDKPRRNNFRKNRRVSEFEEAVVDISRVTVVVKGGRRFSFSAVVVVGNKKGRVGYGHGKANEVPDAIKKAIKDAQRNLITVPIIDKRTVPHIQEGKYLASKILLKPAPKGKGIIASGAVRMVVELAGYQDIYTKSLGSRSKPNTVKATIEALMQMKTIEQVAKLRDKSPSQILG